MSIFSNKLSLLAALFLMFGATACNTIEGMGEDAEAAGDAAEDATDGE
ncbi:Entericidin EcnAB [Aquisalinus flavus]|uniref:Uncharacterized protein n=1 Tax=Aquisalinus flavus TaxID=1526572 RepID=A0A8J2V3N4_9PROT|nr:Entericidin EcnAB [Aquisalinus flavus]MBD0426750.1 Entericidin EcnAB [Aquisalinus flavus]GGC95699.1 hypothetical protein GCM10011342_00600 [Aquisalinus flavus]